MKPYLLLLSAVLVPSVLPPQASAHHVCVTLRPDPQCSSDGGTDHTCVSTENAPIGTIVDDVTVCVGTHG